MRGIQLKGLLCDTVGAEGLKANICLEMLVMQLIHACMHTHTRTHFSSRFTVLVLPHAICVHSLQIKEMTS